MLSQFVICLACSFANVNVITSSSFTPAISVAEPMLRAVTPLTALPFLFTVTSTVEILLDAGLFTITFNTPIVVASVVASVVVVVVVSVLVSVEPVCVNSALKSITWLETLYVLPASTLIVIASTAVLPFLAANVPL